MLIKSIKSNLNFGKGHGPINHLSSISIGNIDNEKCSGSRLAVG